MTDHTFDLNGKRYATDAATVAMLRTIVPSAQATGDGSAVQAVISAGLATGRIHEASSTYYPEMGDKPDETALFEAFHVINGTMALRWRPEQDTEARAAFKRAKVRPRGIELRTGIKKGPRWGATCTYEAYRKLYDAGLVCREALLD